MHIHESIHAELNDISNDFLLNVNSDSSLVRGLYTLEQLMDYITWIGLEGTQEYMTTINSIPDELAKKQYVESVTRTKYTHINNFI